MKDIDRKLYETLSPKMQPDAELNRQILNLAKEDHIVTMQKNKKRKHYPAVAAAAVAVLLASSATTYAVVNYMSTKEVAKETEDRKLEAAFSSGKAVSLNKVQEQKGYQVRLLGMISGKDLSDYEVTDEEGKARDDRTYIVAAIKKTDGGILGEEDFFASPLISGYRQQDMNIATLCGGATSFDSEDRTTRYEIIDTDNIEPFADHKIYLAVQNGGFFDRDKNGQQGYLYDEKSGTYSRNTEYDGVNALFELPLDASLADHKKAEQILHQIEKDQKEAAGETETESEKTVYEFMSGLTPENIGEYATPLESTRLTCKPDSEGMVSWSYDMGKNGQAQGKESMDNLFPDGSCGMSRCLGYTNADQGLEDLYIHTFTLNKDGSVTFLVYVPKK
ncbi:hypothetical protein SAMN02910400_01254 [Lachnospiraceae bacterium C10]|nr:hypothetical protein SAMN02910400_01254 [Lachnospiraceae bacterium C10]